jgi:hypothetical protein
LIRPFNTDQGDYYTALNSPKWFETRQAVLDRDGNKCRFCGCTDNLQAHHIRYQNDRGETDYFDKKYIVTLCRKCHQIVSDAVNEAKQTKIEVPAFMVKPGISAAVQIENKIKHAAYCAEADLVAATCFRIWKRTLDTDCGVVNMRNLGVLKPIGEVVRASIEYQAGMTAMGYGVAFSERTINLITQYIAEGYNHYLREGHTDYDVQRFFKLTPNQMVRVRRQAERLLKNGADGGG